MYIKETKSSNVYYVHQKKPTALAVDGNLGKHRPML